MKTLRWLQEKLQWKLPYSYAFWDNPEPHKMFRHAVNHVGKALGHLQAFVDDLDHDCDKGHHIYWHQNREKYEKYIADVVICAVRLAQEFPGAPLDLHQAVLDRAVCKDMLSVAESREEGEDER